VFVSYNSLLVLASTQQIHVASTNCDTIAEIACNTEGFSTLCAAVEAAGLENELSSGTWTVFAPTDEAFDYLPDGTLEDLLDDVDALTNVLLFHAVADKKVYSSDLKCTKKLLMANGKYSRTVCRSNKIYQKGAGNSRNAMPQIISKDIKACNGVVHVVNQVMLPP
jgi:uncharacterized surface protein with fasciclin (FAS1) repeats